MAWETLSLHFRQTYDGGYRYLDKCGELMLAAREVLDFLPVEAKPTGAKMEIPEEGLVATCDSTSLEVTQELAVGDHVYFLNICQSLSTLVMHHFQPKGIIKNGFAWKSHWPCATIEDMFLASLKADNNFASGLGKEIGFVPEHKKLDYMFVSGSKDLHLVLHPVTFQQSGLPRQNAGVRALRDEKNRIDRKNRFAERIGTNLSHALVLELDLMENDPPEGASLVKHFEELKQKVDLLRKTFALK